MDNKNFETLYQNVFDDVHASEELLGKVKNIGTEKKKIKFDFRLVSAVAACLVVVILGAILINPFGSHENSFVLKAGATEIGSDSFVEVCELYSNLSASGSLLVNGELYPYECRSCLLKVFCEGKNIETVRYTIENGVFIFPLNSYAQDYRDDFPKAAQLSDRIYNRVEAVNKVEHGFENELQYSSFTIDYEDQLELEKYNDLDSFPIMVSSQVSMADEDLSDKARRWFESDIPEEYNSLELDDERLINYLIQDTIKICNEIFRRVRITVEVTYEDKTTDSETITFACTGANEYKGFVIGARIVNE